MSRGDAQRRVCCTSSDILIVEADESLLRLTQWTVARLGYQSLTARSRQDAIGIALASEGEICLALIDTEVPQMDELEV